MLKYVMVIYMFPTILFAGCDEVETLALNMYHEARGEGEIGMQLVGEVTLNRVEHDLFPDNICDVVYQRRQFSWTMNENHTPKETDAFETAIEIAEGLVNNDIDLLETDATYFLNPFAVTSLPRWARQFEETERHGNHVFYRR